MLTKYFLTETDNALFKNYYFLNATKCLEKLVPTRQCCKNSVMLCYDYVTSTISRGSDYAPVVHHFLSARLAVTHLSQWKFFCQVHSHTNFFNYKHGFFNT